MKQVEILERLKGEGWRASETDLSLADWSLEAR